jgi:hypothetical protein
MNKYYNALNEDVSKATKGIGKPLFTKPPIRGSENDHWATAKNTEQGKSESDNAFPENKSESGNAEQGNSESGNAFPEIGGTENDAPTESGDSGTVDAPAESQTGGRRMRRTRRIKQRGNKIAKRTIVKRRHIVNVSKRKHRANKSKKNRVTK